MNISSDSLSLFQSHMRKNTSFKITSIAKSRPASNDGEESADDSADDTEDISDNVDNGERGAAENFVRGASTGINFTVTRQNSINAVMKPPMCT